MDKSVLPEGEYLGEKILDKPARSLQGHTKFASKRLLETWGDIGCCNFVEHKKRNREVGSTTR